MRTAWAIVALLLVVGHRAAAYIEAPYSLGRVVNDASNILELQVEKLDRERGLIIYRKVRDLKGTHAGDTVRHNIGGKDARETQLLLRGLQPGTTVVMLYNGGASETCVDRYWYQTYRGNEAWWNLNHGEPYLLRSYAGSPARLAALVTALLAGKEVAVPCLADGDKAALARGEGRLQRLRASLKLADYDPKRDFVGWGADAFRPVTGLPGFSHIAALTRVDPYARGIATADVNGDGRIDLCLFGETRTVLLVSDGNALVEAPLPHAAGARAAAWADYNNDGRPDLLLATAGGLRLLTNTNGLFRDDSAMLPREAYPATTAAAWLDADGDGRPDILCATSFHGLRLYRNLPSAAPAAPLLFADHSVAAGLGSDGLAGRGRGDHLAVADVNGDGRPDFLYSAQESVLALNRGGGFVVARAAGLRYQAGNVGPVFGDYDADGRPDLFVPQREGGKLFHNEGDGRFGDVSATLAGLDGRVTSAAWGDFYGRGSLDLLVGCWRGPNRLFRNLGGGKFVDATGELRFQQQIHNSRAVAFADLNKDGVLDVVLNNEGSEPIALLGAQERK